MTPARLTAVRAASKRLTAHTARFPSMPTGWRCRCINCRDDLDVIASNTPALLEAYDALAAHVRRLLPPVKP